VEKRLVTQLDLAQRLGVTQMTVSHAISGKGRMSPETRERVLALASELGYRPNGMARRVQEGRYRGLALLGSATRPAFNIADQDFHISVGELVAERSWHLTEGCPVKAWPTRRSFRGCSIACWLTRYWSTTSASNRQ
jgi:transcriptional regulator with XRE-family HTH domain